MCSFRATNLCCIKQDRELFSQLDVDLKAGDVIHVLGENGSGKTSLLRILAGVSQSQGGDIFWNEQSVSDFREEFNRDLLYLGHKLALNVALSAIENLEFWTQIQGLTGFRDYYQVLGQLGLAGLEDMPVAHLSAGQQRRVSLSRIWLKTCKLLILDEPFNALDKQSRGVLEAKLKQHTHRGGILILTSHWQLPPDFQAKELFLEYNI